MFISPTTVLSHCYFSPVSGAKPLKVCYHLVRWSFSAGELILWVEGYPSPQHPPAKPARPNLMHLCPHILSVLVQKTVRGEHEKPPSREECETLLEGKIGPSISLFLPLPSLHIAHKGSRQAGRNQFHGATRWKWGRKRAEKDREALWRFHQAKSKNNPWFLASPPPVYALTVQYENVAYLEWAELFAGTQTVSFSSDHLTSTKTSQANCSFWKREIQCFKIHHFQLLPVAQLCHSFTQTLTKICQL